MKIAALSDIHGNLWALEAVLADIEGRDHAGRARLDGGTAKGVASSR